MHPQAPLEIHLTLGGVYLLSLASAGFVLVAIVVFAWYLGKLLKRAGLAIPPVREVRVIDKPRTLVALPPGWETSKCKCGTCHTSLAFETFFDAYSNRSARYWCHQCGSDERVGLHIAAGREGSPQ